ncbi:hypothetical protein Scep_014785 [Stephania cephalantha]|uniref:Uncharacterized protein n=1 Tax=Stephania cephalantha TaxID=152367 RepID=A0AAP0J1X3_9MAGN
MSLSVTSLSIESNASICCLFDIGASSQMTKCVFNNNFANIDCLLTLHVLMPSRFIANLNLECAVRPPGNNEAATPDDAVANAIIPSDLTFANIALYKKVFPVPPGPSIKNKAGAFFNTLSRIESYAFFWARFNFDVASKSLISTVKLNSSSISLLH